jgi:hypothetical protein
MTRAVRICHVFAGFSAGRDEAIVRRKLIEAGHVDVMIIRPISFTRTVPANSGFWTRESERCVIKAMIDARNIYRKVTVRYMTSVLSS